MTNNANQVDLLTQPAEATRLAAAPRQVTRRSRVVLGSTASALALLGLFALGYIPKSLRARSNDQAALERAMALPEVSTYVVHAGTTNSPLLLPGNIEPITDAVIYARIDGYVQRRLVDIGDRVRAGQLLAVISSPETDQELHAAEEALKQARSDLNRAEADTQAAKANLFIADVTNKRWQDLVLRKVVSQEEADSTDSTFLARKAEVASAEARQHAALDAVGVNQYRVQRLKELVSYERVTAPFPGIITQRNIDLGSLVSAGSSASVPVLYHLAKIDRLRIYVDVPQSDSEYVHLGQHCTVRVRELGERNFQATVTRFANSLDVGSRTMRTEVQLPNPQGDLMPGMYATVRFDFIRNRPQIVIPANTLVPSPSGDQVVVVRHGVAHYQSVRVATDFGADLEVSEGVKVGDVLIANVTDDIREGTKVRVSTPPNPGQK